MGIFSKLNKKAEDGPEIDNVEEWLAESDDETNGNSDGNIDSASAINALNNRSTDAAPMTASELIAAAPPADDQPPSNVDSGNAMWHMPEAPEQESFDTPSLDAPSFDAASLDAPSFDAPSFDAPSFDAPSFDTPSFDAPAFSAPAMAAEDPSVDVQWDVPVDGLVEEPPASTAMTMSGLAERAATNEPTPSVDAAPTPPPPTGEMIAPAWTSASLDDAVLDTDEPTFEAPAFPSAQEPTERILDDPADLNADVPQLDTEPASIDTDAISTDTNPFGTDSLDTDSLSTDPLSTDPLSTDPLSTDPLSTDPLSTEGVVLDEAIEQPTDSADESTDSADESTDSAAAIPLAATLFDARPATTDTITLDEVDQAPSTDLSTAEANGAPTALEMPRGDQATVLLEILGLDSTATWPEARSARAALVAEHNPELESDPERAELALAIRREMNTAYAALRLLQVP